AHLFPTPPPCDTHAHVAPRPLRLHRFRPAHARRGAVDGAHRPAAAATRTHRSARSTSKPSLHRSARPSQSGWSETSLHPSARFPLTPLLTPPRRTPLRTSQLALASLAACMF